MNNLRNSFPEKSEKEIKRLCKDFYHYFCDLFLETFKTLTISRASMLRHCSISPEMIQLLNKMADEQKSVILVLGHKGNWEWAGNSFSLLCKHQLYVIYHPLANKYFDGLMYKMRTRFGTKLIPMNDTFREMIRNRGELNATAFIADQTPQPDSAHWMTFMNQDTPVFRGTELIAAKLKRPVVYISVKKLRRGYYMLDAHERDVMLPENYPAEGALTEAHTQILEKDILTQPETWLWSHKRWKHKKPSA